MRADNSLLLVEDDASLRRSLGKFLNQAGYAFYGCSTAVEALAFAQKAHPHVAIVGYHLPDASGLSLIEKLNIHVPDAMIIVLSEFDLQALADVLNRVKIETFLQKPFDLVDFEAAVRSACTKAGIISTEGERAPEAKLSGAPASSLSRGNLGTVVTKSC